MILRFSVELCGEEVDVVANTSLFTTPRTDLHGVLGGASLTSHVNVHVGNSPHVGGVGMDLVNGC